MKKKKKKHLIQNTNKNQVYLTQNPQVWNAEENRMYQIELEHELILN